MAFVLGEIVSILYINVFFMFFFGTVVFVFSLWMTTIRRPALLLFILLIAGFFHAENYKSDMDVSEYKDQEEVVFEGKVDKIENKEKVDYYYSSGVLVLSRENSSVRLGNRIRVVGKILLLDEGRNPGGFNEKKYFNSLEISSKINAEKIEIVNPKVSIIKEKIYLFRESIKNIIYQSAPEKEAGIFAAILLGDKRELDSSVKNLYQKSGIGHILAISGLHISLIGVAIYRCMRKRFFFIPSMIVSGILMIVYVVMVGGAPSAIRALIMFLIKLAGDAFGRSYDLLSGLAVAVFLITLENPGAIQNVGFQLSVMAIFSIGFILPAMEKIHKGKTNVEKAFWASFGICVGTTPFIIRIYYEFPLYGILANMILVPLSSWVLASGIISVLVGKISIILSKFIAGTGIIALSFMEKVCGIFEKLPCSSIITGDIDLERLLLYFVVVFLSLHFLKKVENKKKIVLFAGSLFFIIVILFPNTSRSLEVTFLDVGQGDGIFFREPGGETFMIDGGSSSTSKLAKYTLVPFYKHQGVKKIDYWFVTHYDMDHYCGIMELLENYEAYSIHINTLVVFKRSEYKEEEQQIIQSAKKNGIKVLFMKAGDIIKKNRVTLRCLYPKENFVAESENDYSLVLELSYGDVDILLTGDLEHKGEDMLMTNGSLGKYEVLKVGHHGSKGSSGEDFLEAISPKYGIISCGDKNFYGHPHIEATQRLSQQGVEIFQTRLSGAITLITDGKKIRWSEYIKKNY